MNKTDEALNSGHDELDQTYGLKKFDIYADYVADQIKSMYVGEKRACSSWTKTFVDFRMTLSHISGRDKSYKTRTLRESIADESFLNFDDDSLKKPEHKGGVIYVKRVK